MFQVCKVEVSYKHCSKLLCFVSPEEESKRF